MSLSRRRRQRSRPVSAREERRRIAYRMFAKRVPKATIARQLGVSYVAVWRWEARWRTEGPDSWREHEHPGSKKRITPRQQRALLALLKRGARAYGYPTDLWTLKRVAGVIRKEYGVEYTLSGVWRVLRALGLSAQVPLQIALERDEGYIRWWKGVQWPTIAEEARRRKATVVFADESGIQTTPNVRRSWARMGSRLVLKSPTHHEKVSTISGVTADGEIDFELHEHDITGTEVIWFLEQLLEEIPGRIVVLWDNGGIHRCVEVNTFVWLNRRRLELRRFPPYAPELNPDEGIWDVIKNDKLANDCPKDLEELKGTVETQLRLLQRSPHRVQQAMRQSTLNWELLGLVATGPTGEITLSTQA
ncbi:MAG: IS630 family transposase [Thermoplasmata archaeon]